MKFHAKMLSAKLVTVLEFAANYLDENKTRSGLAQIIANAEKDEFSYIYRDAGGTKKRGYVTSYRIERYISFLQDIKLLDEDFTPQIDINDLSDIDKIHQIFADSAKDFLSEKGIGVRKIWDASLKILKDDNGTLPTVELIFDSLDCELAEWKFRWLIEART